MKQQNQNKYQILLVWQIWHDLLNHIHVILVRGINWSERSCTNCLHQLCHSSWRRANAFWCSVFTECRWQRYLGHVKGASWGSSKNGMIETWDINMESICQVIIWKTSSLYSIHSSETTKINRVGKRAGLYNMQLQSRRRYFSKVL